MGGVVLLLGAVVAPVAVRCGPRVTYMAGWGDDSAHMRLIEALVPDLEVAHMPEGVRRRAAGDVMFWFNYTTQDIEIEGETLSSAGVLRRPL